MLDWIIIILIIAVAVAAVLFFLNRWAAKKHVGQQSLIEKTKQRADIYVIDKKRDKAANVNLPKAVQAQMPKTAKLLKLYFIKAKVGPQVTTLMCDKHIFNHIEAKKNYKVELAGMYIASVKGLKTAFEMKEAAKARKSVDKAARRAAKGN